MKKLLLPIAALAVTSAHAEMPSVNWSGDFRYRHENTDSGTTIDHQAQQRIRARLQAKAEVSKGVTAKVRLASGGDSITSTNQTLGDGGSNKELHIDIFSVDWNFYEGATVTLGKMSNPFYAPGSSDIVFDSDVTPEGIAVSYEKGMFFANAAQYWIANNTGSSDVILYAPQAGVKLPVGGMNITASAAWYNFSSLSGQTSTGNLASKGNTTSGGNYAFGYKVLNANVALDGKMNDFGYGVFFDYIKNGEVDNDDTGWLAGTKLSYKSWSLGYDYRWMDADSTLSILPDSDIGGSVNTGVYGHRTKLGYKINKNISSDVTYYANTISSTKKHYDKYQLNLVFKF